MSEQDFAPNSSQQRVERVTELVAARTTARSLPAGIIAMRALRPLIAVMVVWTLLAAMTYWSRPLTTVTDAVALSYNENRWLGWALGVALMLGSANLVLTTFPGARRFVSRVTAPLTWPWRSQPLYVRRQWANLLKVLLVVAALFLVVGALRSGNSWQMINDGLAALPVKIPEWLIWGAFYMVIMVSSFLLLFVVLARGGVTTYLPEDITTSFDQVWGQDRVVERVKETVLFLSKPDLIEKAGGHVPTGVLLWGPPGTGKTLIAEAVAGETGTPFVLVEPGAFQNMFVGIGVLRVKTLYRKLRKLADVYGGVVVFFDEADVLGSRGPGTGGPAGTPCQVDAYLRYGQEAQGAFETGGPVREKAVVPSMGGGDLGVLNAILAAMQGVRTPRGWKHRVRRAFGFPTKAPEPRRILHFMATNLPSALDPALLRPGRIDRLLRVGYPSREGRRRTFEGYLAKIAHDVRPEQIDRIAGMTPHASGAAIKDIVNEALIESIRTGRSTVTFQDLINAKRFKEFGPPEGIDYIPFERHAVAVHEACHAVVAWRIRKHLSIDTVTIEKGPDFLGMVSSIPAEDTYTRWASECRTDIAVAIASLAGERLFFGDSTSGVSTDLDTATRIALAMVSRWGMGAGAASAPVLAEAGLRGGTETRGEVEDLLAEIYQEAEALLEAERDRVLALAHALEVHRTLTGQDVEAVFEYQPGVAVDGRRYDSPQAREALEAYHALLLSHRTSTIGQLPSVRDVLPSAELLTGEWPGVPMPEGDAQEDTPL